MVDELQEISEKELFIWIGKLIKVFPSYKFEDVLEMDSELFFKISAAAASIVEQEIEALKGETVSKDSVETELPGNDKANLIGLMSLYGHDIHNLEEKNYILNLSDLKKHQREKAKGK